LQTAGKDAPQVVRDAAGAEHEHALIGQRRQRGAQGKLQRRALAGYEGQRQDRHICVRIEVAQRRPVAMVQAALRQCVNAQSSGFEQRGDRWRERRCARRVVAQRGQLGVESAEVVHRLVLRRGEQHMAARGSVRRNRDDGFGPAERGVDRRAQALHEGSCGAGFQRNHRRAVGDENRGEGLVHCAITAFHGRGAVRSVCTLRCAAGKSLFAHVVLELR
jgi:hypothetical protein